MAGSPLQAFDPFAKHPFTAHGSNAPGQATQSYSTPRSMYPLPTPSSLPTRGTPQAGGQLKSPQALPAGQPIFTPFRKDRASPDLPDVKKKAAVAWGGDAKKDGKKQ